MNVREQIDKFLTSAAKRMEDAVASLLAIDFQLGAATRSFIGKADFFGQVMGRQVVAKIGSGSNPTGAGCLMLDLRDAIRLGGTLIMLSPSELEEFIGDADYRADIADSFGEIAGALCDALNETLAENYPQSRRLLRQEQVVIAPGQVDIASSEPFPDQACYQLRAAMRLAGLDLGDLFVLLPARLFDLDAPAERPEDRQEWQSRFDSLFAGAAQTLRDEFTSLLGVEVRLDRLENRLVTKEEFCREASGATLLMTNMEVAGEANGAAYLFCALKDAIHLGGTLIMLPPSELEVVVAEEHLTADTKGGYGEIANMVAGVYSNVFAGQGRKNFRLVKRGLQKALFSQAGMADEASPLAAMAHGPYCQTAMDVRVDGRQLGRLWLLLPADLLELGPPVAAAAAKAPQEAAGQETAVAKPKVSPRDSLAAAPAASVAGRAEEAIEALVIGDDEAQAERIAAVIAQAGMTAKQIHFKDNLYSWLPGQVRVVFLVMRQANEQAFSIAIKIGAVCRLPLVAVAPGWTRSRVLKAARYGVSDILTSPASEALISETLRHNLAAR